MNVPRFTDLVAEVQKDHLLRQDRCETVPLEKREFKPRPRPKTAIIALAAQEAIAAREWADDLVASL